MRDTKAQGGLRRVVVLTAIAAGTVIGAGSLTGCRVDEKDVERWGTTQQGPVKLVAVVSHDKYDIELRQRAALELATMKPRGGRRIGISGLVDALGALPAAEREHILEGLVPKLLEGMKTPLTQTPDQRTIDTSIPYKDTAFALLSYETTPLITDEAQRKQLTEALIEWTTSHFDVRLTAPGQTYSMEQVMRFIGADAVKPLPALITGEDSKYDRLASLIAELGDGPTKEEAAKRLVDMAKSVASKEWFEKTKPEIDKANKASKLEVTPAQLEAQVTQFQDESLTRVFGAIRKIDARAAVEFCLSFAADGSQSERRRLAAVAALEKRLDGNEPRDVERILALATADSTPDPVRDLAFARIAELPREKVVDRLYSLFGSRQWKLRAVSAQTVLKMSKPAHIAEFMAKLPGGASAGFAVSEPLVYGRALADMAPADGKTARDEVLPFLERGSTAARLTALGYFYVAGTANDLSVVTPLASDRTPTPRVDDEDAKWHCDVQKSPDTRETVAVSTIGDFVRLCVEPQMKTRT